MEHDLISHLIADASKYCDAKGIKLSTLGARALNDTRFFARLQSGREALPRTIRKVRDYMAANPATPPRDGG